MFKLKYTLIAVVLVLVINFTITIVSGDTYVASVTETIDCSQKSLWNHLLNVKDKHLFRSEIDTVIVHKRLPGGYKKWEERHKNDVYMIYQHDTIIRFSEIKFTLLESSKNVTGKWKYELAPIDALHCQLTITDEGKIDGFFNQWMLTLLGKDFFVKRDLSTVKEIVEKSNAKKIVK